jgi:hypothetical protein
MKKIVYIILLLVVISSCKRKPMVTSDKETSDSTSVKETWRIDTVTVPGEKIYFDIPCPEADKKSPLNIFKSKKKTVKSERANVSVEVGKDNIVRGVVDVKDYEAQLKVKDTEIFRLKKEKQTITKTVYDCEPKWYDIMCRWIAAIAFIYLSLKIILKFYLNISI